jgi:hypothetical protein
LFPTIRLILTLSLAAITSACSLLNQPAPSRYRRADRFALSARPNISVPLQQLRPAHPRLLATIKDFARARDLTTSDPLAARWLKDVKLYADTVASRPPLDWSAGPTIELARNLQQRIMHLAFMYRLTGDRNYATHARDEMLAAARAENWLGNSFLITAETTASTAIGYDWLFDVLSEADRKTIRTAITSKGLAPGRRAYDEPAFWVDARHNWNLVCNAGMMLGALAVCDEDPAAAKSIVSSARESLENGFTAFAPDGAWEEGPTYWNYASRYACYLLSSLQTALGATFTAADFPGFAQTGDYRMHIEGPTEKAFNYADSGETCGRAPQLFFLARAFNKPHYAAYERTQPETAAVLDLLWFEPAPTASASDQTALNKLPTTALFRGSEIVAFRGSWADPNTTYIAFKGGSARAHHGHLDLGSFVLDTLGQRFALDLGSDKYSLPGYSSGQRFTYYRTQTRGHNTLSFNQRNQDTEADVAVIAYHESREFSSAAINLTSAYDNNARRTQRGIALVNATDVLVQDEIDPRSDQQLVWTMHTEAAITLDGAKATLKLNSQTLTARILSPAGATFTSESASAPAPQSQQPNVRRLMIRLPIDKSTRLLVQFTPADRVPATVQIQPLSRWPNDRNLADARTDQPKPRPHKQEESEPEPDLAPLYIPHQARFPKPLSRPPAPPKKK